MGVLEYLPYHITSQIDELFLNTYVLYHLIHFSRYSLLFAQILFYAG
jgi:hypothetical protein